MEVSSQLHAPVALSLGKNRRYTLVRRLDRLQTVLDAVVGIEHRSSIS
jgi:hypothetical protein